MAAIDDKVVSASFESSKFESGVNATISALEKLKAALRFDGASKGLQDLDSAGKQVDLSHIGRGVDDIKNKLGALSVAALAVFANIAQHAIAAGAAFLKSFTLAPILQGFQEYSTTLNSVQTILANTQASGATLGDVNKALQDLNTYSDKTIYNFSQMARNIGTFTAAGVDLKTSTEAIKGIANLAALSGSNADQASTAMYQLSQAIAAGQVHLQDWNSVVNAGMGGTVFQRALATTAENMGRIKKGSLELVGPMKNVKIAGESFRQSLVSKGGKSWLTSDVLTATLKQFTGDLTDAELKASGFTASQIKAIQQTAKTAQHAATEVKTISQVFDVAKETMGSGWAQTFQIIFGTFTEAKGTFTALSNTINGFINASAKARNKVLGDWKALGGRTVLLEAIGTLFKNLGAILKPIREAFRDIFPAKTGQDLLNLTWKFQDFAEALKPGPATIENLKRTFKGFFAILDIGKQIIGGIFTVFGKLFGSVGEGSGGFLKFTGSIGDFLVKVDEALKKGDRLHNFFAKLGIILSAPLQLLKAVGKALAGLFDGFSPGGFFDQLGGMTKALDPLSKVMKVLGGIWDEFVKGVGNSGQVLKPAFDAIIKGIEAIGPGLSNAMSNMNFDAILTAIRTGLFGGLVVMLKQFLGHGSIINQLTGRGGVLGSLSGSFGTLTGTLKSMQHNLQAKTLKEIAIAIALLTLSVVALSFVNPDKLKAAIVAMGFMFAELLVSMKILDKISKGPGFIKLPFIAASLILLAIAIDLLTISVAALSRLSWEELLKGLTGVGVLLGVVSAASIPLSKNSAGMIRAGIGITAMAIGLRILASAVGAFADMSWGEMLKGLTGVAVGLGVIAATMQLMPTGMVVKSAGILLVATALKVLAGVVTTFGNMNWQVIDKGLAGIGGALVVIGAALHLMPKNLVFIALGLIGVTAALAGIAKVVESFGGMSAGEMAKGLIGLAGSLAILAGALVLMSGSLAGATSLAIAAAGIALLAPALKTMGAMSWGSILKGMVGLGVALGLLIGAGYLVAPLIPVLLAFGATMLLIGAGLALAGAGIALIGIGLSALVIAAPLGMGILIAALEELIAAVPKMVQGLILGLLQIVDGLAASAPKFVNALLKILTSLIDVVIQAAPKIGVAFNVLIGVALSVLKTNEGKIIQAGFDLLLALLNGIKNNIGQIVTAVAGIIVKFLGALANNLSKIITAGTNLLLALLKGIANNLAKVTTAVISIVTKFISAVLTNLGGLPAAGLKILTKLLKGIGDNLKDVVTAAGTVITKFITEVGNQANRVVKAGADAIIKFIQGLGTQSVRIAKAAGKAIVDFLNGLTAAVNLYAPQIRAATRSLGFAIIDGMTGGLLSKAHELYDKVKGVMNTALGWMHKIPGVHSPSTVTFDLGQNIMQGLINGIDAGTPELYTMITTLSTETMAKFREVFKIGVGTGSGPMYELGQMISTGFAKGVRGSTDDVISAFSELNTKIMDTAKTAKETIKTEQANLDKLLKEKKPDLEAIKKSQEVVKQNQLILKESTNIHNTLISTLKREGKELLLLSANYDLITQKLQEAEDHLASLKQEKEDAIKSVSDQYQTQPDFSGASTEDLKTLRDNIVTENKKLNDTLNDTTSTAEQIATAKASVATEQAKLDEFMIGKVLDASGTSIDVVATYLQALKTQGDSVATYSATLDQLRKLGLDDATYQKLLTEGTADQSFATKLLAGGKTAVDSLNILDADLKTNADKLALHAENDLKKAGIAAAEGIIKGLKKKKGEIFAEMDAIGREMVAALKRAIKSKSPSEEFATIGAYAMEGLSRGLSGSKNVVIDTVKDVAHDAMSAMRLAMRGVGDIVAEEIDPNLVLTPVIDLTNVQSQVDKLSALTSQVPITAAASFGQAVAISSEQTALQAGDIAAGAIGPTVKFEQNNYSPEALTEIEIYRHTRNQLSQLKSVLAL